VGFYIPKSGSKLNLLLIWERGGGAESDGSGKKKREEGEIKHRADWWRATGINVRSSTIDSNQPDGRGGTKGKKSDLEETKK